MARMVNGKIAHVTDVEFVTAWKSAARNGGTLKGLANSLQLTYNNVLTRAKRLNEGFKAAGQPELPKFARPKNTRTKDYAALAQVGE
jgi:hypothetical protein